MTAGYNFSEIGAPIAAGDKSATSVAILSISRDERCGPDSEARWRMRLIVPHIRRATLIGKVIDLKKAEAATLDDTLDGLSAGVFLVEATGRLLHANAAGHASRAILTRRRFISLGLAQ